MNKNKKTKNNKLIEKQFKGEMLEAKKIIKICIGILLIFIVVYLLTALITGDIKLKEEEKVTTIQYEEILVEQTFKQNAQTYYVLYYDFDSNNSKLMTAIFSIIGEKGTAFKVDLSNISNKNYLVDDNTNIKTKVTKVTDLKIKNPTLIKITNKKIEKFVTGIENIKNYSSTIN